MNKTLIRGLAIGFFLSGMVIFFYPSKADPPEKSKISEDTYNQLVKEEKQLRSNNKKLSDEIKQLNDEITSLKKANKENTDKPNQTKDKKVTYTLNIISGMDSKQISQLLADEQIILHADDLNDWLTIQNLHRSIQVGTYKLTSEMSIQTIVEKITK